MIRLAVYVTRVRKESAGSGESRHSHIVGVCVAGGAFYSNSQVVTSIKAGQEWKTLAADSSSAVIEPLRFCPHSSCIHSPYLTTKADKSRPDNLENLPPC